jgi:hypothetical protein
MKSKKLELKDIAGYLPYGILLRDALFEMIKWIKQNKLI